MEYNSLRPTITIPEYGRNVQNLVSFMVTVEDKKVRTELAHNVIDLMAQMNPTQKNNPEYKHKLWDHLHIISDYKLDIDGPFDPPSQTKLESPPTPMKYPQKDIKYKHYGLNIELMVAKAEEIKDSDNKKTYVKQIVSYMKTAYQNWHFESVSDEIIITDLEKMSNGKLTLAVEDIPVTRTPAPRRKQSNNYKRHSNNNYRRRKNNK